LLNVLGHTVLGFEQSVLQPLIVLVVAYAFELATETLRARRLAEVPRYGPGLGRLVDFLLPAHITALAVTMLLYANDRTWPLLFALVVALGSKLLVRVPVAGRTRHVFNPSNLGIAVTLLVFPWVGIAPPYHFTENTWGWVDWLLPLVFIASGTFLNAKFTRKLPLIGAWLGGFALQAVLRSVFLGTPIVPALLPMSGVAFLLFTFYMVTDPGTTPRSRSGQVIFGLAVAMVYGALMLLHVVFGLFFSLAIVCTARLLWLWFQQVAKWERRTPAGMSA
ncbi:MAG: RnfABCDGE type electron transport complex subunit D, partial [Deltaproteobacteria bacterium]|nr:RnfABCDGE type electron transport complex subunit D [Deltaproteobacteria bacterium]